jgi:purine-nucleoside phosphorylase
MSAAADWVRARIASKQQPLKPQTGLVLGSGLGAFAETLADRVCIPYAELPGFPLATAVGHKGELVLGRLNGVDVAVMSGRFHLYEGYSARDVTAGIRLFHELGIDTVVLTNAAGGINASYRPGSLVLIADHINLTGVNPLTGPNDNALGPRFPDMTEAYCEGLRSTALEVAEELKIPLQEGVYAGLAGPSYETPAEIRFLRIIGADLVGMSTVAEAIAARHMCMEVLGISCVTNAAAGMTGEEVNHEDVLAIGHRVEHMFSRLLTALLPRI